MHMAKAAQTEIPVTLHLSKEAQEKLAKRAAASGQDLAQYLSTLVESLIEEPRTLAQISGATYQHFAESGTTDDQLSEELERAKHEMRADHRARRAS